MATALLAIGDSALGEACRRQLQAAGYAPVRLKRPIEVLTLAAKLHWDVLCLDETQIGRDALALQGAGPGRPPLIGLGIEAATLDVSIPLPLVEERLVATVRALTAPAPEQRAGGALRLDSMRRVATVDGRSVQLTRTEFRLLEFLMSQGERDVSLPQLLSAVWGSTEGKGTEDLVRSHVRNLRHKLSRIGLADAVRSRRGLGYAFVV